MLSILIPAYDYDCTLMVKNLHGQATGLDIPFEILVYEDGSKSALNVNNRNINLLKGCTFKELEENIGRSAIRNLLGRNAKYGHLLFVDAGTYPKKSTFVEDYVQSLPYDMVIGGMTHLEKAPTKPFRLRWLYTKNREANFKNGKVFCASNFMIKKSVLQKNPFDESLKKYGYEDVVFYNTLKRANITIRYLDNPVIHDSNDDAHGFLLKTQAAIENLRTLIATDKISADDISLAQVAGKLKKAHLNGLVAFLFSRTKSLMIKNFESSRPSLILFDFYRLGYYCSITKNRT